MWPPAAVIAVEDNEHDAALSVQLPSVVEVVVSRNVTVPVAFTVVFGYDIVLGFAMATANVAVSPDAMLAGAENVIDGVR